MGKYRSDEQGEGEDSWHPIQYTSTSSGKTTFIHSITHIQIKANYMKWVHLWTITVWILGKKSFYLSLMDGLSVYVDYESNRPSADPQIPHFSKWDQVLVCRHPITGTDWDILTLHFPSKRNHSGEAHHRFRTVVKFISSYVYFSRPQNESIESV